MSPVPGGDDVDRDEGRSGSTRLALGLAVASLVTVVPSGAIAAVASVAV